MMLLWLSAALAAPCDLEVQDGRIPDPGFTFVSREASLTDQAAAAVERVACVLEANPDLKVHIEIHTDSRGSGSYNHAMSQRRADALRQALVARGIAAERLSAAGCGENYPITSNDTPEGQARNRRIELWAPEPVGREACPVVDVPEPEPAPPPAPRLPTDCATWTALSLTRAAAWPGAKCEGGLSGWTCTVPEPIERVEAAASACLSGTWDGPEWIAGREGWALVLSATDGGTTIRAR